jgi:signal peptide peptidase SppA
MEYDLKFWAGTEESLALYLAAIRATLDGDVKPPAAAGYRENDATTEERQSRLLSRSGDLAIIKISGPLNNSDSWMNEWRGMTGYPEIREALIQAATDTSIAGVILDINSGGGAVSGVFDTSKLIQKVDKIKPVHAFSDGIMASAAYLLGSSARSVSIGRMTEAGSIGVLTVHQEMSKMMKDIGITPTVLRAGKYKALGNPYEELTETAKAEIQEQLDYQYRVFVEHVADRRKVSYDVADKKLAQGRIFIGDRAAEIGLVDAVTTFDDVASKLQGGIDAKKPGSKYAPSLKQGSLVAATKPLTDQDVAALALGAGTGASADAGAPTTNTNESTAAAPEVTAPAAEGKGGEGQGTEAAAPEDKTVASADAVVTLLRTQLSESQDKVLALSVEVTQLKEQAAKDKGNRASFRSIAEASVVYLRVALKATGGDVTAMSDDALLSEQASLRATFEKTFKAGGVASTATATAENRGDEAANDPLRAARIAATRTR